MTAPARTTLLDIVKANGSDKEVGLVVEAQQSHPEIELFPARTIKGTQYKTLVVTELPTVGFRKANNGPVTGRATYVNKLVEAFILNPRWEVDKAVADAYEDGAEAWMGIEGVSYLAAAFATVGRQIYYGTSRDADGFPGFKATVDSAMVVDATGSTADTASSVWGVHFGVQDCRLVVGNNGELKLSDIMEGPITGENDKPLTGYIQEILSRVGMQVLSRYSIGCVKNLTAQTGKTLDDDMIADLIAKFPVGRKPDLLLMSRRSQAQLQKSRTATTTTGAPAPFPTDAFGIRIAVTDSISDTEAIA